MLDSLFVRKFLATWLLLQIKNHISPSPEDFLPLEELTIVLNPKENGNNQGTDKNGQIKATLITATFWYT